VKCTNAFGGQVEPRPREWRKGKRLGIGRKERGKRNGEKRGGKRGKGREREGEGVPYTW